MELLQAQAERFGTRSRHADVDRGRSLAAAVPRDRRATESPDAGRRVIIATGASPKWLGLPAEQKFHEHGVSRCATCDGAFFQRPRVVRHRRRRHRVEEATFLTRFAHVVTLIHRRDELRASKIMVDRALANPKIKFALQRSGRARSSATCKPASRACAFATPRTGEKSDHRMHGVFVAIGHVPNTSSSRALDLDENGYICRRNPGHAHQRARRLRRAATSRTTSTARPSPPPAPAAWPRSRPSGIWRTRLAVRASC